MSGGATTLEAMIQEIDCLTEPELTRSRVSPSFHFNALQ